MRPTFTRLLLLTTLLLALAAPALAQPGGYLVTLDVDGDGVRVERGTWVNNVWTFDLPGSGVWQLTFGLTATDLPVLADYDGDGLTDIAVFRPAVKDDDAPLGYRSVWYVRLSTTGATWPMAWGTPGDVPVPGDYDGDGKADVAIVRYSDMTWRILYSGGGYTIMGTYPVVAPPIILDR